MPRPLRWLPLFLFVVLVAAALWPALCAGSLYSARYDWRYFDSMSEMSRRTVVFYRQVPLWNPYSCGGEVDLANPQSLDGAPTFLLTLLFGTAWGFKAAMALYYLLALGGMYKLSRRLELGLFPSLFSAVCYGLCGYLATHLSVGHINFAGVGLFPFLVYCFDRALANWRWILPAGALMAWVAVYGGTFTPALAGELLLLWATAAAFRSGGRPGASVAKRLLRAYGLLLACAGVALLLGAYRMLPVLEFIYDHPRPLFRRTPDVSPIWRLPWDLFAWRSYSALPDRKYWAHEYTARLPQVAAPLLLLLPVVAWKRPGWRRLIAILAVPALVAALLSLGNFSPAAPWSLLQRLPVLRDLRVPSRHLVLLVFFLALLAGIGCQAVLDWLAARRPAAAAVLGPLLLAIAGLDAAAYTHVLFRGVFTVALPSPREAPPFYHVEGHWSRMRELMFDGYGVLRCDEEAPLQRAVSLDAGNVPQARLVGSAGTIVEERFSPNVRTATVDLQQEGGLLLLNSNWNEHFRLAGADSQHRIRRIDGRLAVDLGGLLPGRHTLQVIYAPRSFTVGLVLSLLAWPLALALFFTGWRAGSEARSPARRN